MTTTDFLNDYCRARLSTIPIAADGSKKPAIAWKEFQRQRADINQARSWWGNGRELGIAIICGAVSGNLEVIDFDNPATFDAWSDFLVTTNADLHDKIVFVQTPCGYHGYYRCPNIEGNQKLAMTPKGDVLIETRGEGGYILAPGCPTSCHETGRTYEFQNGATAADIQEITPDERKELLTLARGFDRTPQQADHGESAMQSSGDSPGDEFNKRAVWEEVLEPHGWQQVGTSGGKAMWRRPGKDGAGHSATTGCLSKAGNDLLCVFSTNAHPFEGPTGRSICSTYTKFAAYAVLNHQGDFTPATKELVKQGYGSPSKKRSGPGEGDKCRPGIASFDVHETQGDDGKPKTTTTPKSMADVLGIIRERTNNWPRRIGTALFIHETDNQISWLEKTAALVGYLGNKTGVPPKFAKGVGYHSAAEVFEELRRTARAYLAVEVIPHHPLMENVYYACPKVSPGDGQRLGELVRRYCPETDVDSDLILAMFVTPGWGSAGNRPSFGITSDAGRGSGKSTLAQHVGLAWGGRVEISPDEPVTVVKERLLSPAGITKRVAVIDNLKSMRFSSAGLEALVTTDVISGKRMYVGEASRPNNLVWITTLNGVAFATDWAQRSVIIKLKRPEYNGSWKDDTEAFIVANRDAIVADCIGFLQRPVGYELSMYSRWGNWERDVLARLPEPAEAQKVIGERQAEADAEGEETTTFEALIRDKLNDAHYTPDVDRVFIPSRLTAVWLSEVTGDRFGTTKASRFIRQRIRDGGLKCIAENTCNTYGKGFVWNGQHCDMDTAINTSLEFRIEQRGRQHP